MAPRKTTKNQAEQPAQNQEQKDIQLEPDTGAVEQTGQELDTGAVEQTGQELDTGAVEQTGQELDTGEAEQTTPEPDEFADIPNPCVYCGPSVRGVARQYTTYQGGIPAELKEFVKAHPAVRRLIVPTTKFASVRKRLETHGTAEAAIYKKVRAEL